MSTLRNLGIALVVLFWSMAIQAATPSDYAWITSNAQNVSTVAWAPSQIASFIAQVTNADAPIAIGDFEFTSLLGDGSLNLVASVDTSGRGFFNQVVLVRQNGGVFSVQRIDAFQVNSLKTAIADLNGDGVSEIVLPLQLTPYLSGPTPLATWTAVYAWDGTVYRENTAAFAAWYLATIVPMAQSVLTNAQASGDPEAIAAAQIALDKADRVAGLGATNGLAYAQSLALNADPALRVFAAAALGDIGTPAALASLTPLLSDSNADVVTYATASIAAHNVNNCARVGIQIISGGPNHQINLQSKKHICVVLNVPTKGPSSVLRKSLTLGETGFEQSLLHCTDDLSAGIGCNFQSAYTNLQVGDGVITLRGAHPDGSCVVGQTAVQVVNVPTKDTENECW